MLCSHLTSAFGVNVTIKLTLTQRMYSDRFCVCVCVCVITDAMLNFDSDANANADVKCERDLSVNTPLA